jgi:hypothetical protein
MGTRKRLWSPKVLKLFLKIQEQKQLEAVEKSQKPKLKLLPETRTQEF